MKYCSHRQMNFRVFSYDYQYAPGFRMLPHTHVLELTTRTHTHTPGGRPQAPRGQSRVHWLSWTPGPGSGAHAMLPGPWPGWTPGQGYWQRTPVTTASFLRSTSPPWWPHSLWTKQLSINIFPFFPLYTHYTNGLLYTVLSYIEIIFFYCIFDWFLPTPHSEIR